MNTPADSDRIALEIGARVKALRTEHGLSGRKLAAACGVSQPFLSQLESGQTSVAIATLYRIAGALGVGPADLLPASDESQIEVLRAPEISHMTVSDDTAAASARAVWRGGRKVNELLDYSIEPGQHIEEWFETDSEYLTYVLEGALRVEIVGHPDVVLEAGDILSYRGPIRSRWHLESDSRARVIVIGGGPEPRQATSGSQPT